MNGPYICGLLWAIFGCVWLIAWIRTKRTQERAPLSFRFALWCSRRDCFLLDVQRQRSSQVGRRSLYAEDTPHSIRGNSSDGRRYCIRDLGTLLSRAELEQCGKY